MSKNGLTLKSGFGVVQGHWKWRRSTDHVWLFISRPLWLYLVSFARYFTLNNIVTLKSGSLKVIETGAIRNSYPPSIVTMAIFVAVSEIFSVKEWCDLENRVRVHSRSLEMAPFDRSHPRSYSPSIVTMALSCIVCEIYSDLLVENSKKKLYHTCIYHLRRGSLCQNFVKVFGCR